MKEKKPDKNNIGILSWIINVILLSAFWPAGVILLIMRLGGNDVISKLLMQLFSKVEEHREDNTRFDPLMPQSNSSSRSRAARQGFQAEQPVQPTQPHQAQPETAQSAQSNGAPAGPLKKEKDPVARIGKGRTLLIVFGWLLLAAGVLTVFEPLSRGALWRGLESVAIALGGAGMLFASWKKGRKGGRAGLQRP